jgi:tetratricopeptide (TPR) repeat protein
MRWIGLLLCGAAALSVWAQSAAPSQQAERARQLVASGKAEQAIPIYEELLAATPANATLLVNLSVAQYEAGRYADVIEQARKALELRPDLTTAWLFLGAAHFKLGEPARAIEPFEKVLQARPAEKNANLMLAEALLQLERYDEAARRFLSASRLLSGEVRVWYGLERACDAVSRQAAQSLEANAADSAYRFLLQGDFALRLGRYAFAVHSYQQALQAQPEFGEALRSLVRVYQASGHADWARQVEQRLEDLAAPDCPSAGFECSFQAGRYEELLRPSSSGSPEATASGPRAPAESLYWRAKACGKLAEEAFARLSQLPESARWRELQARRSDELGIYRDAVEQWRKALELDPTNGELRKRLALSLYSGGNFEQALPIFEELLGEQPDSAELNYLAGSSLLLSEEPRKGIPYLRKAIEKDPESRRARGALGGALLQLGSFEEAIPHLQAVLAIDEDGRIHYQLGRAYQGAGREQAAREAIETYQRIRQAAEEGMRAIEGISEVAPP